MAEHLKVLDCDRKAILLLPPAALKLWLCYWMNEDEENESYLSLGELEDQMDMRMSRRSIITWTKWLLDKGWLVEIPGKTAADKFLQRGKPATRGAYQIKVFRVDDPTKCKDCTGANSALVQIAHKVSGSRSSSKSKSFSGSESGSGYESDSDLLAVKSEKAVGPVLETENQTPETNGNTKTKSKTCPDCGLPWSRDKNHVCPDPNNPFLESPMPKSDDPDFDDSWKPPNLDQSIMGEKMEFADKYYQPPVFTDDWRPKERKGVEARQDGETPQETVESTAGEGKSKATPTTAPLASAPHSADPPKCGGCGGTMPCRDEWCYCYEPAEVTPAKTTKSTAGDGKPTPTPTAAPWPKPPAAAPPRCQQCGESDDFCSCPYTSVRQTNEGKAKTASNA
jgi:hypothetical protein